MVLLLQTLNLWLQIRVLGAHWALSREIEKYCDDTESAILEARRAGDDARADRLRQRFERAAGLFIPAVGDNASSTGADVSSPRK